MCHSNTWFKTRLPGSITGSFKYGKLKDFFNRDEINKNYNAEGIEK